MISLRICVPAKYRKKIGDDWLPRYIAKSLRRIGFVITGPSSEEDSKNYIVEVKFKEGTSHCIVAKYPDVEDAWFIFAEPQLPWYSWWRGRRLVGQQNRLSKSILSLLRHDKRFSNVTTESQMTFLERIRRESYRTPNEDDFQEGDW